MAAYASVSDARNEGVPVSIADATVQAALDTWSRFIDDATRQWFESRTLTITLDGTDSRVLFLPVPVISLTSLYINGDFNNVVSPGMYSVYANKNGLRDDRRNPKIMLASSNLGVYEMPDLRSGGRFALGTQNQKLIGAFGFVEEDGSTPMLIKRATLKLAIRELQRGNGLIWDEVQANQAAGGGQVQSETTDGHTISYAAFRYSPGRSGLSGTTNDAEVDDIIRLYRGPLKIASTPGHGGPDRRF